jgi:hypothetical protein
MSIQYNDLRGIKIKKGLLSADLWVILGSGKKLHYGSNNKRSYYTWKSTLEKSIPEKVIV